MYQIGILQLTQHLDDAVEGFKAKLTELHTSAVFHYRNADGHPEALPGLADELFEKKIDLIFACSTPSAAAAIGLPGEIPVVFTPVFDPAGAGLVASLDAPGGKATGVSGMVPIQAKLDFFRQLLPGKNRMGVLYDAADPLALLELSHLKKEAQSPWQLVPLPIHFPAELSLLPEKLADTIDFLFLPIGKNIEENFATVAYYGDMLGLPIFASHGPNVPAGALGALVADHYQLGCRCGAMAADILTGTPPSAIPVGRVEEPSILLNQYAADALGIRLPASLVTAAKEIYE